MPYNRKTIKKICIRCNKIYESTSNRQLYCPDCMIDKHRERSRKSSRKYRKTHIRPCQGSHRNKSKKIICNHCNKLKLHEARGLCYNCYYKWYTLCKQLSTMSEQEKIDYLEKYGLLDKKIEPESFIELSNELNKLYMRGEGK